MGNLATEQIRIVWLHYKETNQSTKGKLLINHYIDGLQPTNIVI